ncbi:FadR/GntR family transcriptional regulator [Deinococcus sp.]|uniref:FadR/GntR family transcriptional regulator n=1 Tax=Deinococcus sp. TaxID=47478 RepID=UPI003CC56292
MVQDLGRRIVRGELNPGVTLPTEPVLVEQYGVSRTVLRDAVRSLVDKGLLVVRQGSGMRVRPAEDWDHLDPLVLFEQVKGGQGSQILDEVLEVRRLVEVQAAEWAAHRRSEIDLAELSELLRRMQDTLDDGATFTAHDIQFHEVILRAAANRLLRDTQRPIAATLRSGRVLTASHPGGIRKSMQGHQAIFQAIRAQDSETARSAMTDHLSQFEHDLREELLA